MSKVTFSVANYYTQFDHAPGDCHFTVLLTNRVTRKVRKTQHQNPEFGHI